MEPSENDQAHAQPQCFGVLETVFPQGEDGLREVTGECWPCSHRIDCLRQAVNDGPGAKALSPAAGQDPDPALSPQPALPQEDSQVSGFIKRWSRLKSQSRKEEG